MKTIQTPSASITVTETMIQIIQFTGSKIVGQVNVPVKDVKKALATLRAVKGSK